MSIKKLPALWRDFYTLFGLPVAKAWMSQSINRKLFDIIIQQRRSQLHMQFVNLRVSLSLYVQRKKIQYNMQLDM